MACRIAPEVFAAIATEELKAHDLAYLAFDDSGDAAPMCAVDDGIATLHRKPIQALVDEPEQARPIIRNLLRWAKEHGAR